MAGEYGATAQSEDLQQLVRGPYELMPLTVDASATTFVVGQVFAYDATGDNYVKFASGLTAAHYAVAAEAGDVSGGDAKVVCLVSGRVCKTKLDATAQGDAEINTALAKHGIIAVPDGERLS